MNNIDTQYQTLLQDILDNGVQKKDRTGTGTISVFGRQIRHKMSEGFPLLTTKKMGFKTMVTELLWFLRGDTNIKYLVNNGCHIWDGDAYKAYKTKIIKMVESWDAKYHEVLKNEANGNRAYTQEEFIERIKTDDEFAEKWGELGPIYGKQWRKWDFVDYPNKFAIVNHLANPENFIVQARLNGLNQPIDQIANLINDLKTNPDSRRLMVSAWNVGEIDSMVLPPCHYGFQVYTRELSLEERSKLCTSNITISNILEVSQNCKSIGFDKDDFLHQQLDLFNVPKRAISLMWNQRSVDTFIGLPFNIASYALLLEIIAKEVNMIPDELIGNLGDVHLYSNHIEQAKEQITRSSFELPKLVINSEFWNHEYQTIDGWIGCMEIADFQIENYQSHPSIKAPLSN